MDLDRRHFLKLFVSSLLLTACRTGPLPLPTSAATSAPHGAVTPAVLLPPPLPPTAIPTPRPTPAPLSLQISQTPLPEFYDQTYADHPDLQPDSWSLKVEGLVNHPATFHLSDILAMPAVTQMRTLECIGNPIGGSLIGNTIWKGALFTDLMQKASVKPEASWVVMRGADQYLTSVPLKSMANPDTLLAYEMGGETLPPAHGFPLRLLAPGVYGQKQPKWITGIEFTDHAVTGTWENQGWSNVAAIKPNGIIDDPSENDTLTGQLVWIKGIAFADASGVARVEVSTDRGRTYADAQILSGPSTLTWTVWAYAWQLGPNQKYTLVVRVTDGNGQAQRRIGSLSSDSFPDGSSDMHSVTVEVLNS
jgi:DMSO/TMAO reductase YedYZ molybdopterin-dependent catalytic subunit